VVLSDVFGREVAVLFEGPATSGTTRFAIDASTFVNGVYNYTLTSGGYTLTQKLVVAK
jgi:hypothetical protein